MQLEENQPSDELENSVIQSIEEARLYQNRVDPEELYILPLTRRPFFPGMAAPIAIEPGPYYEVLKKVAKSEQKCLGLFLTRREECDIYNVSLDDLYSVGVLARILRIIPMEQGGSQVILSIEKRIIVEGPGSESLTPTARVFYPQATTILTPELKAYAISIITTIKELLKLNPLFKEELQIFLGHSDYTEPEKLADFAVTLTTANREELQGILETFDIQERTDRALLLLKKELDLGRLQNSINQRIEASIAKSQREFFLKEQLKTIKKELGLDRDERSQDRNRFQERLKSRTPSPQALKTIQDELEKLSGLEIQSAEYAICRNYLDWLTSLPWGILTPDHHDLKEASSTLDQDHFGLEEIKERILELIAITIRLGKIPGTILCLVGPPGVGKTSIGESIARALKRKFYRFSVGGMRDEAEIKGHRRTYIGAMPGKLIQAIKHCETMNPVIMLDEVDKMGSSHHGDPASALLEALDPEQNREFLDHFLDVRCDISNVLFIATANVLDTIPKPLIDRMEVLRLPGYIDDEKFHIAKGHLVPKIRKEMNLEKNQLDFTDSALREIISDYSREAGVRSLKKYLQKVLRKGALRLTKEEQEQGKPAPQLRITSKNLLDFLKSPPFPKERFYSKLPVGVATGLAWTSMGGAILYFEAIALEGEKSSIKLTGQAGSVMKESLEIAWNYLKSSFKKYCTKSDYFSKNEIHLHIPEGATPKDGPSAGITMVTALLSLLTGRKIRPTLAMTGELTLTGKVLPVGGIREKIVAAKRCSIKEIILPLANRGECKELPESISQGVVIHYVDHYDEVPPLIFTTSPSLSQEGG